MRKLLAPPSASAAPCPCHARFGTPSTLAFERGEVELELPLEPGPLIAVEPGPALGRRLVCLVAGARAGGDGNDLGQAAPEAVPGHERVLQAAPDQPLQLQIVEAVGLDCELVLVGH